MGANMDDRLQSLAAAGATGAPPRRVAILVLGMHRSGTSALTGVISALGAALPKKTLMGSDECNQRGLFEGFAIACAHDELLASARSHWHDWRQLDPRWFRSAPAEQHRQKIKAVLVEEFGDAPLIVLKDPRICRFLPFMSSILAELDVSPVAVLPVRSPLEVAYSLKRRNGFALSKSALLWLRHVLDAEVNSRHMRRCFLSYEELLLDWRSQLGRVAEKTGVVWPDWRDQSEGEIDQFLTTDLRHEAASSEEIENRWEIPQLVRETYGILEKIAAGGENADFLERLDEVRGRFDEGCRIFGSAVAAEELAAADRGVVAERDSLAAAHNKLVSEHDALAAAHKSLVSEHKELVRSHHDLSAERDELTRRLQQPANDFRD